MLIVKEKTSKTQLEVSRKKSDYYSIVKNLPEKTDVTFGNTTWNDYETLLHEVGEASHLRISFTEGNLRIMTLSSLHEYYSALVQTLITHLSFQKKIKVL